MADRTPSPQPESPEPLKVPEELLAIQQAMEAGPTPGPWIIATSNSWRRIVTAIDMTSVCEPVVQRDGHPDLHFSNGGFSGPDACLIEACNPAAMKAVLAYIAELQAARNEAEAMRADAERYRWLRDVGDATWRPFGIREGYSAKAADAAIDAAMKGDAHA